jgi:hypothetical protein
MILTFIIERVNQIILIFIWLYETTIDIANFIFIEYINDKIKEIGHRKTDDSGYVAVDIFGFIYK